MYKASGKKTAAEELTLEREGAGTSVQSGTKSYFLKQSQILIPRLHVLGERVNGSQINHLLLKKAQSFLIAVSPVTFSKQVYLIQIINSKT